MRETRIKASILSWDSFRSQTRGLVILSLFLSVVGLFNIYSATSAMAGYGGQILSSFVGKQFGALVLAAMVAYGLYRMDYRWLLKKNRLLIICVVIIVLLAAVIFVGANINGAKRWIALGGFSLQPSEFAKIAVVAWVAAFADKWYKEHGVLKFFCKDKVCLFGKFFTPWWLAFAIRCFIIPFIMMLLVMKEPDLGTTMLIFLFGLITLFLAGIRLDYSKTQWIAVGIFIVIAFILAYLTLVKGSAYRMERVDAWFDPFRHRTSIGYQPVQGLIAIGSGGLFGMGYNMGLSKFFYLPEAHTDFAFAVWCQDFGFIGAVILLVAVVIFMYYAVSISLSAKDRFGRFLAGGATMLIGLQALFNVVMVCAWIPVTGVPFPFLSYGGSSLLMDGICVGLLLSVSRQSELAMAVGRMGQQVPSIQEETQSQFKPKNGR